MMNKKNMGMITITTAAMLVSSAGAMTETRIWFNPVDSDTSNPANWRDHLLMPVVDAPDANDDVFIYSAAFQPQVDANWTINSLYVDGTGSLSFDGAYTLTVDDSNVTINGQLDINQTNAKVQIDTGNLTVGSAGEIDLTHSGAFLDLQTGDLTLNGNLKLSHAASEFYAADETSVSSTGVLEIVGEFTADGPVEVDGEITVDASGQLTTNDTLDIASGATLDVMSSGSHSAVGAMTVDGAVRIDGAMSSTNNVNLNGTFVIGSLGVIQANSGAVVRVLADEAIEVESLANMDINSGAVLEFDATPGMSTPSFEIDGDINLVWGVGTAPKVEILQDARLTGIGSLTGDNNDNQFSIDSSAELQNEISVKGAMQIQSTNVLGQRGTFVNNGTVEAERDGLITFGDELNVTDNSSARIKVSHADGEIRFERALLGLQAEFEISTGTFDFQASVRTTGDLVCSGSPLFSVANGEEFRWLYNEPGEDFINVTTVGCP